MICLQRPFALHTTSANNDPDRAAVAQSGEGRHQQVHGRISQVCLNPVQNGKFKRAHAYHLTSWGVSKSFTGFRGVPQRLQYPSPRPHSAPQAGQVPWNFAPHVRQKDAFCCQTPQDGRRRRQEPPYCQQHAASLSFFRERRPSIPCLQCIGSA